MKNSHTRPTACGQVVILTCLLAAFGMIALAQSSPVRTDTRQAAPANLDLEQGEIGQVPTGWIAPTKALGYPAELVADNPKSGARCALIRSEGEPAANSFGNLMQSIDAAPYRGRRVRFRAAVRTDLSTSGARGQLWLRVDRPQRQMGFFDTMDDRPITSAAWQYYEIVGDVEEDAVSINFGLLLIGKGKVWLDDVSFEDLGKAVVVAEPARPLSKRGLQNLIAYTRLLGYVRHFHPSDEAAATNWDAFAIEGIRAVEDAKDAIELARRLEVLFRPVAPTVRVFETGKRPSLPKELTAPADQASLKIISWNHRGFGNKGGGGGAYMSERVKRNIVADSTRPDTPAPQEPFTADLGGGASCLVPLALYADDKGTLPHASKPAESKAAPTGSFSGNDRATRLADVALAWNVFQHFYPYFDVVKTDWPRALEEALTSAATDADEKAFLRTLRLLVAKLYDGHGNVFHQSDSGFYTIPALWEVVEGRLVITHVAAEGAGGLQPGDVVLKVGGKDALAALSEEETLISGATPQWRRYTAAYRLRMGLKDSEVNLEVQTQAGKRTTIALKRSMELRALEQPRPEKIQELKQGIFYLDISRLKDEEFQAALPRLEQAKGIIFDLRGYPTVSPVVISHLIDKPVQSARWNVPLVTVPDHQAMTNFETGGRWELEPIAPRLKAKIAFLTDGRAISYAESYMGIIEAYKLAEIVGETTAGTNGNINPFVLPGRYNVIWTGMKVLKHDGSQHHGIGIKPTVPASRTIRGVAEKRDEQLERAIEVVSK